MFRNERQRLRAAGYRRVVRALLAVLVALVASTAVAIAEAPVVGGRSPRTIGRAGVGTASDDGGGALLVNPAGLARRSAWRLQLATAFVDDEMYWLDSASAPASRDQSSSRLLPLAAIEGAVGDAWIVGAGVMTTARSERVLRRPGRIPPEDFGNSFAYRYAGLSGAIRRDTLTIGAARRLGDTVAIGLSLGGSRVGISEERRLWAGNTDRVVLGASMPDELGDPRYDVELALTGTDAFIPSAVAGVLLAPADSRIELAASVAWSAPARAEGDVAAVGTPPSIAVELASPHAQIEVEQPLSFRTGARWLGEHWIAEVGADLWWFPHHAKQTDWEVDGVTVVDTTTVGVRRDAALDRIPSRLSTRTHGALRAAIDVELISGFLWATGGYAYTTGGTPGARLSTTFGDLGGHTAALGLEANAGGFTITFGWARTWSIRDPEPVTKWRFDNPLGTGDGSIATGTFDGSTDMIGVSIDAEISAQE
jgi:hypothetical protein